MRQVQQEKEAERAFQLEKSRLVREEKALAVQRLQRIEAYKKEEMQKKMEEDNRKMAEMAERKEKIKRQQALLKKDQEAQKRALDEVPSSLPPGTACLAPGASSHACLDWCRAGQATQGSFACLPCPRGLAVPGMRHELAQRPLPVCVPESCWRKPTPLPVAGSLIPCCLAGARQDEDDAQVGSAARRRPRHRSRQAGGAGVPPAPRPALLACLAPVLALGC